MENRQSLPSMHVANRYMLACRTYFYRVLIMIQNQIIQLKLSIFEVHKLHTHTQNKVYPQVEKAFININKKQHFYFIALESKYLLAILVKRFAINVVAPLAYCAFHVSYLQALHSFFTSVDFA